MIYRANQAQSAGEPALGQPSVLDQIDLRNIGFLTAIREHHC